MYIATEEDLLSEIEDLKSRLSEAQEAIDAIKNGSVDAFAIRKDGKPEVFTLQSLDYAYRVLIEKFSEQFALALQGCSKTEITLSVNNKDIPVYVSLTNLQPQLATVGMIVTD